MNIDPYRERCQIPELDPAKLRRVAFCVDVEIAAPPKYTDPDPEDSDGPAPSPASAVVPKDRRPSLTEMEKAAALAKKKQDEKVKNKDRNEGRAFISEKAMFETFSDEEYEIVDGKTKKEISAKVKARAEGEALKDSQEFLAEKKAKVGSPPKHHDFGKYGMFEIDDFDEGPELALRMSPGGKVGITERKGSGLTAVHRDFGPGGMFEIPDQDENETPLGITQSGSQVNARKVIAGQLGEMPKGTVISQHMMFEIPDSNSDNSGAEGRPERVANPKAAPNSVPEQEYEPPTPKEAAPQPNGSASKHRPTSSVASVTSVDEAGHPKEMTRKKEKKKRSEEERKERKERRRQAALADGKIPLELSDQSTSGTATPARIQSQPTTDPLRIYRRCCQLRETTPLPRLVEQLSSASASDPLSQSVVLSVDLSFQHLALHDVVALGDWLAVVPVRRLILEGCDLSDEGVRVVLAGLSAAKTPDQAKHNKRLTGKQKHSISYKERREKVGVIDKLSFKANHQIGKNGWRYISLFIYMSRSLRAIDLSMIPFPKQVVVPHISETATNSLPITPGAGAAAISPDAVTTLDTFEVFYRCLAERFAGSRLEEVVMGDCSFSPEQLSSFIDAVICCGVTRLGLANNALTSSSLDSIARYIKDGKCLGLDLAGNDLSNPSDLQIILSAIDHPNNGMYAMSLADCGIAATNMRAILSTLVRLPNFMFIDLSHNKALFAQSKDENKPNAVGPLRQYLPQMKQLKRIHLNDVDMESEHAIALAEICPEVPALAHLSILENPGLSRLAKARDEASREEAFALYASLMAAVRVSRTIVSIDVDVPDAESSEVVKALAKQVVAYSLRNMVGLSRFLYDLLPYPRTMRAQSPSL